LASEKCALQRLGGLSALLYRFRFAKVGLESGSIPINAASSNVDEFRNTLTIKSVPMFPEPMIATLTGIHAQYRK
jgi:hypothetical protein